MQEWHGVRDVVIQDRGRAEMMEKSDQGQCSKRNLKRMDIQEDMSGTTGMQQWNKGLRHNLTATSEEEDDNHQHQRTKQKAGAMSGKHEDM
jgi:hypothetical protein